MIKKKYHLRKEVKEALLNLGIEVLTILFMFSLTLLLVLINGIMF